MFEKVRAILVVWRKILTITPVEGKEYVIRYRDDGETVYLSEKSNRLAKTS